MSNRDAEKELRRVFNTTIELFNKLLTFHSIAMKGLSLGAKNFVKDEMEDFMKLLSSKKSLGLIAQSGFIESVNKEVIPKFTDFANAAAEAACVVFAHGIVDACTYEYLNVISLAAPNLFEPYVKKKKIELLKYKGRTYEQLLYKRIRDFLIKEVERKSLIYKLDLLHKIAPPKTDSIKAFEYDREHFLTLDKARHSIVHQNIWRDESLDFDVEFKHWVGINLYLLLLVLENTSLRFQRPIESSEESKPKK